MSAVLVTGGSGFVGSHCILKLLAAGHTVRATVRHLEREADVRSMLKTGGADPGDRLSFFAANPESDAGWTDALAGCEPPARGVAHPGSRAEERGRIDRAGAPRRTARAPGCKSAARSWPSSIPSQYWARCWQRTTRPRS
jgi:nucleoside-diphosphate-sugar epimerase